MKGIFMIIWVFFFCFIKKKDLAFFLRHINKAILTKIQYNNKNRDYLNYNYKEPLKTRKVNTKSVLIHLQTSYIYKLLYILTANNISCKLSAPTDQ